MRTLLLLLLIVVALFGTIFAGTKFSDATWTPKLALDLEGGTQIILTPTSTNDEEVTSEDIQQAINVIRQRVDGSGVSEAEITSQGGNNIVVALPGQPSQETIDLVRRSAQMNFRPVLTMGGAAPTVDPSAEPTPEASASAEASEGASGDATAEPTAEATPEPTPAATTPAKSEPQSASDAAYWITPEVQKQFDSLDCTLAENLAGGDSGKSDAALVACGVTKEGNVNVSDGTKYILGPVEIEGTEIKSASSGKEVLQNGTQGPRNVVNMEFTSKGADEFADVTARLATLSPPQNQFAMVLDGLVISAPSVSSAIPNGRAEISGSFTPSSAALLANQLNYGSLPLTFEVKSQEQISATLGSEQLEKGLLAGLIGLALVVVYSLLQYRALGLLTVGSLVVAAVLTYGVITLLSWTQGYRLSLPGVAGLIVAIGITADSFIVYFERIRDELREGRTLGASVERGWDRAKRTILASDTVNLIAAIVLYATAVGGVRGFAFTLGITTVIDVIVVFMFTHPVMELIAKTKFFGGGHPASGLDPRRLGAPGVRYVGRGKVVTGPRTSDDDAELPMPVPAGARSATAPAPQDGLTIAERRAAARAAAIADAPVAADEVDDAPAADAPPDTGPTDGDNAAADRTRPEGSEH